MGSAATLPEMLPFSWERSVVRLGYQLEGTGKAHLCPDGFVAEGGKTARGGEKGRGCRGGQSQELGLTLCPVAHR